MLLYVALRDQNTLQKYKQTNFDRIMEKRQILSMHLLHIYDNIILLDTFLETYDKNTGFSIY